MVREESRETRSKILNPLQQTKLSGKKKYFSHFFAKHHFDSRDVAFLDRSSPIAAWMLHEDGRSLYDFFDSGMGTLAVAQDLPEDSPDRLHFEKMAKCMAPVMMMNLDLQRAAWRVWGLTTQPIWGQKTQHFHPQVTEQ